MATRSDRFLLLGSTEYAHEKEALDFVRDQFPTNDPFLARGLIDLLVPRTGQLYELDLLVIGYFAIYHVEIKSHPGRMEGDEQGWDWTPPGETSSRFVHNPLRLANQKCKVLKSLLESRIERHGIRTPFVQPLVFLSAPNVENHLSALGRTAVVTRDTVMRALQFGEFPGVGPRHRDTRINLPTMRAVERAFEEIGLRPRKGQLKVGEYVLGPVFEDGDGERYQDRTARHEHFAHMQHRARVYLVPEQRSVEDRQRLKRAAEREVQLLWSVREHPHILTSQSYLRDAPLGPTLIFEDFEQGLRLDQFVQRHPTLAFTDKIEILRQVGGALQYCHRRNVVHGSLSPESVLVRKGDTTVETRLFNFQLGASEHASATIHRSTLDAHPAGAYQAPELAADPTAMTPASDTFSLGALAYYLFTGQAPARSMTELLQRLQRERYLDPGVVADDLPGAVIESIICATQLSLTDRYDDCGEWVELLAEQLKRTDAAVPESTASVLEADDGAILIERFSVIRVLGHGSSARVLLVDDEGGDGPSRRCALKVSRGEDHDQRVREEGEQLMRLDHPYIVKCLEAPMVLDGRTCLLLSLAGERTVQHLLAAQGSVDLELAGRYGEDLLDACKELEEHGVLHRDVKPANLGVGARNKLAKHLTLFDFSLAGAPLDDLEVGTAAYRDPFLPLRGRWDANADRWSAAVVLHEMLTGVRPRHGRQGSSPLEPGAALVLAAERFDAAVRDRLIEFFTQALAREPADRFESAIAMARAWSACLSGPSARPIPQAVRPSPPRLRQGTAEPPADLGDDDRRGTAVTLGSVTDAELVAIEPTTPVRALPLSSRALNALDRAGLTVAEELLGLPNNRLSAIRGIGSKVAQEILDLRDRWRAQLSRASAHASADALSGNPALVPDFTGPEIYVERMALSEPVASVLMDAGLRTSTAIARAPRSQVVSILRRRSFEVSTVEAALAELRMQAATTAPTTLEGWLALVAPSGRGAKPMQLRLLLGLDDADGAGTLLELAHKHDVPRATLERVWAEAIKRWREASWAHALRALGFEAVERHGGIATLEEAATAMRAALGHEPEVGTVRADAGLTALLRVAAELGADDDGRRLSLRRTARDGIDDGTGERTASEPTWATTTDDAQWILVKRLGELADELASRPVIAASGETARELEQVTRGTPLDALAKQRLVELAALASRRAAVSSRLELYPVGMPARRALELSAQALTGVMTEDALRTRVTARYPQAQPLPPRSGGLDQLLAEAELGLRWDETSTAYVRVESFAATNLPMESSMHRHATVMPGQPASQSEAAMRARDFEDQLRAVVQERKLRVLAVNPARQRWALAGLEKLLGVPAIALDRRLAQKMDAWLVGKGGRVEVLDTADAAGPSSAGWTRLVAVAEQAAEALADELLAGTGPLLLTQAGLIARYNLKSFVARLVAASQSDAVGAIVLLHAVPDGNRPDVVNGTLALSGLLPGQVTEVPREWLENRHGTGTMHAVS